MVLMRVRAREKYEWAKGLVLFDCVESFKNKPHVVTADTMIVGCHVCNAVRLCTLAVLYAY
jgi:hypothetical protein